MKNSMKGCLYLLSATLIWGSAFIAQSVGMEHIGPFTFQTIRCILAVLFLVPVSFLLEIRKGGAGAAVSRWRSRKLWKTGMICGAALFVAASLQQIGLVYTDAGKAGFLTAMYIVLVPILGLFLGKKPQKTVVFRIILAVIGLYLLCCMGVAEINTGDFFLMGCALAFAVQITCIDLLAADVDGLCLNCIQALVVAVLSAPFALLTETIHIPGILSSSLPLLYAGVMSMGVAYTLQIVGQQNMEPTAASLIMSLESVIAALCGWLILKETMTVPELLGCGLVFAAVILSQLPEKRRKKETA